MSVSVLITAEFVLSPRQEAEWLEALPACRRAHLAKLPDRRARHQSLLGTRLLARGLGRLGYPTDALASLRYARAARPSIDLPVSFSVSHGDGRIMCALSTQGPVGVDVERVGALTASDFHLYLSAPERAWAGRSARRFYSVWTRKEAVAKAAGERGLQDVALVDTTPGLRLASFGGRRWRTSSVAVGRSHIAHLAVPDERCDVNSEQVGRLALEIRNRPFRRDAAVVCFSAQL